MNQIIVRLKAKLENRIKVVSSERLDKLQESMKMLTVLEESLEELKSLLTSYSFERSEDEIHFFKEVKPQFFSLLIYYREIYYIEMRMPPGTYDDRIKYLEEALSRIKHFFDMNIDFYQYYRSKSTHLDECYFMRGRQNSELFFDALYFERDRSFSSCCDYLVAKIMANDMLSQYLNQKIQQLQYPIPQTMFTPDVFYPKVKLTWTGKKSELVEQIYAWEGVGCFNNGDVSLKDLTEYIENVFNINLGDYYHTFLEMRNKKGSRTAFLDKLIKHLDDRMVEADSR